MLFCSYLCKHQKHCGKRLNLGYLKGCMEIINLVMLLSLVTSAEGAGCSCGGRMWRWPRSARLATRLPLMPVTCRTYLHTTVRRAGSQSENTFRLAVLYTDLFQKIKIGSSLLQNGTKFKHRGTTFFNTFPYSELKILFLFQPEFSLILPITY